jgi:anti-anti-sigma factor
MMPWQDYQHLECAEEAGVRVFVVTSPQLLDDVADKLRRDFTRALDEPGPKDVVVCLERVGCVSSNGITTLFLLLKRVKASGGQVVLCGVTPQVATVLRLCQLIEQDDRTRPAVFATEPDIATAVRRLAA